MIPLSSRNVLLVFSLLSISDAWVTRTAKVTKALLHRSTSLEAKRREEDHIDNHHSNIIVAATRRQWLSSIAAAMAGGCASALMLSRPPAASAADAPPVLRSSPAICDATVSVWQKDDDNDNVNDRIVYILGTAHISELSATLAGQLVQDVHPNAVFVELDLKRVGGGMVNIQGIGPDGSVGTTPSGSKVIVPNLIRAQSTITSAATPEEVATTSTTASAVVASSSMDTESQQRSGGFKGLRQMALDYGAQAVGNALRGMYKNMGKSGFNPGEEFVVAVQKGQEIGADIVLGDRDVEVTLKRLTQALAATDLNKLMDPNSEMERSMRELFPSDMNADFSMDDPNFKQELAAYVETLKSRERVRKIMGELNKIAPALVQVMLTERDVYMATGLDVLNRQVTVAVMGIAHMDGVENCLRQYGWKQAYPSCRQFQ